MAGLFSSMEFYLHMSRFQHDKTFEYFSLKGLSNEIDFKNFDQNLKNLT